MMKLLLICAVALLLGVEAKKIHKPVPHKRIPHHRNLEKMPEKEAKKGEGEGEGAEATDGDDKPKEMPTPTPEPKMPTATMGYTAAMYRDATTGEASFTMMLPDGVEVKPGQLLMNQCWVKTGGLFPYIKIEEADCNVMLQSTALFAEDAINAGPGGAFPPAYGIAADLERSSDFERRALSPAGAGPYLPFLSGDGPELKLCPLPTLPVVKPTPTPAPEEAKEGEGEGAETTDGDDKPVDKPEETQLERSLANLEAATEGADADATEGAETPAPGATFAACCPGKTTFVLFKFGTLEGDFDSMSKEIEAMCG